VKALQRLRAWLLGACTGLLLACSSAPAPEPGQPGKDVIWLPTAAPVVEKMLDLAEVKPDDLVVDLGSGDGRTVIAAARRGARARGIEFNAELVELSRRAARSAGLADRTAFVQGDLFQADISDASVVTLFLLTQLNLKLRPALLALKPGTRIVSNSFRMGEWSPDAEVNAACDSFCTAYLWIVPAKVEGFWNTPQGELALRQEFQRVLGTLETGGALMPIAEGRLRGSELRFRVGGADHAAKLQGDVLEGTRSADGVTSRWRAVRGTR
jgi:SAM-dependent methyltransferase